MDWKNVLERAGWTFLQAALASLVVVTEYDLPVLKAAALAGVAALLSFAKTVAQEQLELRRG